MTRPPRLVLALSVATVLAAGCSKAPVDNRTNVSGGQTSGSGRDQALTFAACMRANGVKEFPDPDAAGELTIDAIANGSRVDTNTAAFKQALTACKSVEPSGFNGQKRTAEQQAAAIQFAQCTRDNGVKDFPDPTPDSPIIDTTRIPSTGTDRGMSILHAAMQRCGAFAAQAGVRGP